VVIWLISNGLGTQRNESVVFSINTTKIQKKKKKKKNQKNQRKKKAKKKK